MIYFILHFIPIFITVAADASNLKVVTYDNSVNVIVKDLIENWESPFVYLKSRGYLTKDLQAAPDLEDFQQQLQESSGQESPLNKDSKRELDKKENKCDSRAVRSLENAKDHDLKQMFHKVFSSNNQTASEELKSKLNFNWDVDSLKCSLRQSVSKYMKEKENLIVKASKVTPNIPSSNVQEPLAMGLLAMEPLAMEPLVKAAQRKEMFKSIIATEPLVRDPLGKETLVKEHLVKEHLAKEPLFKEPLAKEPLAKKPLTKNHLLKEPMFEEHLGNEPVAKDNPNFDNPNFLSGLAKILTSPEMRRKDKPTSQENPVKSYYRW